MKMNRKNHKSKIFREVNHEKEDERDNMINKECQDEKSHEIHANIDTDQNFVIQGNLLKAPDED